MIRHGKIENGVVTTIVASKNFTPPSGEEAMWEELPEGVELNWEFDGTNFTDTALKWETVRQTQRAMILEHHDTMEIHEREVAHDGTQEADYTITPAKYQEYLTYFQTIRAQDEANHATPAEALAALDALTPPE